ncbi:MAG: VCBS domain-containing protein [Reyranellaceae bacterium]
MGTIITWRDPTSSFDMRALSFGAITGVSNVSASSFQIDKVDGSFIVVLGTGFAYGAGIVTGGVVTGFDITGGSGRPQALVTGLSLSAVQVTAWILANDVAAFTAAVLGADATIFGNAQGDVLFGGAGNDIVDGGGGNDILVWRGSINAGTNDSYNGGTGADTLQLVLTPAEVADPAVQTEIAAYQTFLASPANAGRAYTFRSLGLTVLNFEQLVVQSGVSLPPVAVDEENAVLEAGAAGPGVATAIGDVLVSADPGDPLAVIGIVAGMLAGPLTTGVSAPIAGAYGSIQLTADGHYLYTLNNAAPVTQALVQGVTANDVFTYTIGDSVGGWATGTITIAVVGANDVPTIVDGATTATGSASELPSFAGASVRDQASATIAFADPDLADTHRVQADAPTFTWSGGSLAPGRLHALAVAGGLSLNETDSSGSSAGSIAWTYFIADSALDFLAQGQTLVASYGVTIMDNNGAAATQRVTVTLNGANDAPVVTGGSFVGSVQASPVSQISSVGAADLRIGNVLVNGLGGSAGFGENDIGRNDDGSSGAIDISSVFGTAGINFFGHSYTSIYVNNNGNLTFTGANSSFVPTSITASVGGPIIAPFWADVDTRGAAPAISPGGNSRGTNLVYYDLDPVDGVFTVTWDDVAAYPTGSTPNAFQVQLINEGSGNFDIVYRYEAVNWLLGSASDGALARAGYNAQDGVHSFEVPQSGTSAMASLPTATGNTGQAGLWVFNVRSGDVQGSTLTSTGSFSFVDPDVSDVHTVTVTPIGTDFGTLTAIKANDTTGIGSGGLVNWTYTVAASAIAGLGPRVESFNVTVDDQHGGTATRRIDVNVVAPGSGAIISGTTTGSVTEAGGIANGTLGTAVATGTLGATVGGGAASFLAQSSTAQNYGSFSIDATGAWTYRMNDFNACVQALNVGDTLHDLVTVSTLSGTTAQIDVTIHGANDAAAIFGDTAGTVVEAGGVANSVPGVPTATGRLFASDPDNSSTFQVRSNVATAHGTYSIDADGSWAYALNNADPTVEALNFGVVLSDGFTAVTADATAQQIQITINGANDTAIVTGTTTGTVTEAGGVANGLAGTPVATGQLQVSDVDSPATFQAPTDVATSFGRFSITFQGAWTYRLSNGNPQVDALPAGGTLLDRFAVATTDGTPQQISIVINGINDTAVIGGQSTATLTETNAILTSGGQLTVSDVDSPATFQVASNVAGDHGYGKFSIDMTGAWSYATNTAHDEFQAGTDYTDSVTATTADGTTQVVTVTIHGSNDPAVIGGVSMAALTETNAILTTGGQLVVSDVDSPATFQVASNVAGGNGYGKFSIDATGAWSYATTTAHDEFAVGQDYTDSFTAATSDGTTRTVTVTIHGSNDPAVIGGTNTATLTETNAILTANGQLTATDVDSAATFQVASNVAGSNGYGKFSIDATGAWSYATTTAHDEFVGGQDYTDSFTATTADGTTRTVTVTIHGSNDPAVIGGTSTATLTETNAILTMGGQLSATDVDSAATFQVASNVAGSNGYGKFSIDATGAWSYATMTAHDEFAAGQDYTDSFTATTADGTTRTVTVTIHGSDDSAVITGATMGSVTEQGGLSNETAGQAIATGSLHASDVDGSPTFVARSGAAASHGTFSITAAGDWSYTLNDNDPDVEALGAGDSLTDTFEVATADGTTQAVTITIAGADDTGIDLSAFAPTMGFRIRGAFSGGHAGRSVSSAGDLNGDGYDDVVVGAPVAEDSIPVNVSSRAGEAYVVFGGATAPSARDSQGRAVVDLAALAPSQGFVLRGPAAGDLTGWSVAAAGDLNGDGIGDLIVGNPAAGSDYAGAAYVLYGRDSGFGTIDGRGRAVVDLGALSSTDGFTIRGAAAGDLAGWSVAAAGDVNGDGIADMIVGAPFGSAGGSFSGQSYVVYGKSGGIGTSDGHGHTTLDLATLSAADGFVVRGAASGDQAGWSVATAGDVNGDGIDDLLIGAPFGGDGGLFAGQAYVLFGQAGPRAATDGSGQAVIDLADAANLSPNRGFLIRGDSEWSFAGWSVSTAGDVNGDGFDDLVIGAPIAGSGDGPTGQAYVVFGSEHGFGALDGQGRAVIDLSNDGAGFTASQGFVIRGDTSHDEAGLQVSRVGDFNGDGYDDLLVGARSADDAAGRSYILFGGGAPGALDTQGRTVVDLGALTAQTGFLVVGAQSGDQAGFSVSAAGDVNQDGLADIIVGAPEAGDGGAQSGEAYVLYGRPTSPLETDLLVDHAAGAFAALSGSPGTPSVSSPSSLDEFLSKPAT